MTSSVRNYFQYFAIQQLSFMCMLKHNRAVFGRMDVCFKCFLCFSLVSKNDTDVSYYNFDADQPILIIFLRVLLREYAIKRWFVIPPLLTNVSALPGET